ncbi:MAG: response regulator [Bdellovibrionales bacterium]|nr:response regulator [Bdellovibrionales bacterium]
MEKKEIFFLIVDDSETIRVLIEKFLTLNGFTHFIKAKDGQDALDHINANDGRIDIIICDLNMSPKNGIDLLKKIKRSDNPNIKDAKFLIMTCESEMEQAKEAIELGAIDYLMKPLSKESFSKKIMNTISKL